MSRQRLYAQGAVDELPTADEVQSLCTYLQHTYGSQVETSEEDLPINPDRIAMSWIPLGGGRKAFVLGQEEEGKGIDPHYPFSFPIWGCWASYNEEPEEEHNVSDEESAVCTLPSERPLELASPEEWRQRFETRKQGLGYSGSNESLLSQMYPRYTAFGPEHYQGAVLDHDDAMWLAYIYGAREASA